MMIQESLPGNAQQQRVLRGLIELYAEKDAVQAVILFGSLGRNAGDDYSDLDLAVVVQDPDQLDMPAEVARIKDVLIQSGAQVLCTESVGHDCYFVTENLLSVAIDYYSLAAIDPYILNGWRLLYGSLDEGTINEAAQRNRRPGPTLHQQVHRALWVGLGADIALQRGQFWRALPSIERMRGALLEIFAAGRDATRTYVVFEEMASPEMQTRFGRTLPHYVPDATERNVHAAGDALVALLELLEHHLAELSNDQVELGPGEREFLARLRDRQQTLRNAALE